MPVYLCELRETQTNPLRFEYIVKEVPVLTENRNRLIIKTEEGYNFSIGKHKVYPYNKKAILRSQNSLYVSEDSNIPLALRDVIKSELETLGTKKKEIVNDPFDFEKKLDTLLPELMKSAQQLNDRQLQFVELEYSRSTGYQVNLELVSGQIQEQESVFKVTKGFSPISQIELKDIGTLLPSTTLYKVRFFISNSLFFNRLAVDIVGRMLEYRNNEYQKIIEREKALESVVHIVRKAS